jgi:ABC-type proline/glycine betaine transport system permease subunit
MVVAGIAAAFSLLGLMMAVLGMGGDSMTMFGDADMPEFVEMMMGTGFRIVSGLVVLAFNAFVFFAAMQMKQLQSWPLALSGSIIAMTPCISLCCIIGIPIGIWALVVLFKPEVKEAFS